MEPPFVGDHSFPISLRSTMITRGGIASKAALMRPGAVSWMASVEKPYTSPPSQAAGIHVVHRRNSRNIVLADRANEIVSRMSKVWTTPIVSVSGEAIAPIANTELFHIALIPPGA